MGEKFVEWKRKQAVQLHVVVPVDPIPSEIIGFTYDLESSDTSYT